MCVKRRIRDNLGVSSGLVGCIESLRIASPRLNVEYDLHMPGSDHIESAYGIREYIYTGLGLLIVLFYSLDTIQHKTTKMYVAHSYNLANFIDFILQK